MVVAKNNKAQMVQRYRPIFSNAPLTANPVAPEAATAGSGLALYTPTGVSLHERLDLAHADAVDVAKDGMLETRRGCRELEGLLVVPVRTQTVDQSRGERITGAHAIDDVGDVVMAAHEELSAVEQARAPAIPIGAMTLPEGD